LKSAAAGIGLTAAGAMLMGFMSYMDGADATTRRPSADIFRKVVARLTTPLLPDDYFKMINPLWSARELRGRVVEVIPETDETATLVIKPGWGWATSYLPGQFVGIGVMVDGRWHWRSYSLSSSPAGDGSSMKSRLLTITVKAMPEGFLSEHLVRGLDPGTIVRLALPQGEFVLPDPPPARILFWTGGSGITPVMSMLRTLDRRGTMTDVVHVHASPNRNSSIFRQERMELADRHSSLTLIENFDDEHGTLDVNRLTEVCPDWQKREAWVCGPGPMLAAAESHWEKARLTKQLHLERFSVNLSASAEGGRVVFASSGREAVTDGATTLLEAGEAAGISMPFGCRMGICHTCVLPLKKGVVKDLRNGAEYEANQGVQTCVTAAAGDCVLEV
jgi:ferredoxin-NADP reductase